MELLTLQDGEQMGPFPIEVVQQMLGSGQITRETLAWRDGLEDWASLGDLQIAAPVEEAVQGLDANRSSSRISRFVNEDQDPAAVQKVLERISGILTTGEEVEYVGVQKKPVVNISPDSVILTNKRFIIARPKLTGFKFEDFQWREVHDVHLSEQMLGTTISCVIVDGRRTSIDSIPKKQARKIYAFAQEVEEKMIEERRNRSMEERRASAGGVTIQAPASGGIMDSQPVADPVEQLGKLKQMLDAGLIEQAEYDAKKTEILGRM